MLTNILKLALGFCGCILAAFILFIILDKLLAFYDWLDW
jgi:hypothetical protein